MSHVTAIDRRTSKLKWLKAGGADVSCSGDHVSAIAVVMDQRVSQDRRGKLDENCGQPEYLVRIWGGLNTAVKRCIPVLF